MTTPGITSPNMILSAQGRADEASCDSGLLCHEASSHMPDKHFWWQGDALA